MLAMEPNCERCEAALPHEAKEAHICSYECTFCSHCAVLIFEGVCPNCKGLLLPRPPRMARTTG
jgi:hypothetical protein